MRDTNWAKGVLVTKRPPTDSYPGRKPLVPRLRQAFHGMGEYRDKRTIWLFKEKRLLDRIYQSVSGHLNEGYALGYPECCTRAYEEDRATFVETIFNHIVSSYDAKTIQEAVQILS